VSEYRALRSSVLTLWAADVAAGQLKVCEEVVEELRTFHPEKLIDFQAPAQLEAVFDDSRIAQVLSNLIGNALQYGAPEAPVEVRVRGGDDAAVVAVNNRGP